MNNTTTINTMNNQHYDQVKSDIANILAIENSGAWEIISSDPDHNLYMVHHKPEADLVKYGDIRGIVVDVKSRSIVCKSYGYTPTIVSNTIENTMVDTNGTVHQFINPEFKKGYEG